jgi:hypothetical protein
MIIFTKKIKSNWIICFKDSFVSDFEFLFAILIVNISIQNTFYLKKTKNICEINNLWSKNKKIKKKKFVQIFIEAVPHLLIDSIILS